MEEEQTDKDYLDENFVSNLNSIEDESLKSIIDNMLKTYKTEFTFDEIENLSKEISSATTAKKSLNPTHFIRQLKYLINKGIYSRINKKYKAELLGLGISPEKIELLSEAQKKYHEKNLTKREEASKKEAKQIKHFDMFTEMPVGFTDYLINDEDKKNEDIKKQKVFFNFRLSEDENEENVVMEISKEKLVGMFTQIEKLQEHLDTLS
ncbi:MAG: hypothetical protein MJ252_22860 [archaeon]|nr:hypothetical protein [archaeon]